jgi:two-component system response regulator HydG
MSEAESLVLVIDDNLDLLESFRKVLERERFPVRTAFSGHQGLSMLNTERFDVALVDLRMPEMDGLEVLRRIQHQDPHLPVILITGSPPLESAAAAVKQGAFDYLLKPFTNDQLVAVLRRAAKHRRQLTENHRL